MLLHKETYCFITRFGKLHALSTTVLNVLRFGLVLLYWAVVRPLGITQHNLEHYNNEGHLVCAQLRYPFYNTGIFESDDPLSESFLSSSLGDSQNSSLQCYSFDESINDLPPLLTAFLQWIPNFGSPHKTTAALTLATYAASNAMVEEAWHFEPSLSILTSPGVDLQKPTMPPAAMIVITLLLAVQVAGLAFLAIYASSYPTWTELLDAWAMLRFGAEIGPLNAPAVSGLKV